MVLQPGRAERRLIAGGSAGALSKKAAHDRAAAFASKWLPGQGSNPAAGGIIRRLCRFPVLFVFNGLQNGVNIGGCSGSCRTRLAGLRLPKAEVADFPRRSSLPPPHRTYLPALLAPRLTGAGGGDCD